MRRSCDCCTSPTEAPVGGESALREALEPFAAVADQAATMPDNAYIWHCNRNGTILAISKEDILRARAALASGEKA